jgi:phosphoribosyl-ATP pyrophosphohydrolase/phosphoribosyl-AMP cyclohydrolase
MKVEEVDDLAWTRSPDAREGGLLPAIVQDAGNQRVLMLGYMSREALRITLASGWVTFYSRSRARIWTKGESSGHRLALVAVSADCDGDTLLVQARPQGPTCHLGRDSCFVGAPADPLAALDAVIAQRGRDRPEGSYTTRLFQRGAIGVAQKVGEEGVETALAGVAQDDDALLGEAADLVYHLLVLLRLRGLGLAELGAVLRSRSG